MTFVAHPNQKRSACERCRRQKLRCSRQESDKETRCSRCARLGFPCVAGQQRRIGRPSRTKAHDKTALNEPQIGSDTPHDESLSRVETATPVSLLDDLSPRDNAPERIETAALDANVDVDALFGELEWDEMALGIDPNDGLESTIEALDNSASIVIPLPTLDPAVQHEALTKLSKTNVDLHSQLSKINIHRSALDFCSFIFPDSVLGGTKVSITEFVLVAFQDFVAVLGSLDKAPKHSIDHQWATLPPHHPVPHQSWDNLGGPSDTHGPPMFPERTSSSALAIHTSPTASSQVIDSPLAMVIISCYVQLVSLFEVIFLHVNKRLESVAEDPLLPIEGMRFGAFPIGDGHLQGLIFIQIVTGLLDRANFLLSVPDTPVMVNTTSGPQARLLSANQYHILLDQLQSSEHAAFPRLVKLRQDIDCSRRALTEASKTAGFAHA